MPVCYFKYRLKMPGSLQIPPQHTWATENTASVWLGVPCSACEHVHSTCYPLPHIRVVPKSFSLSKFALCLRDSESSNTNLHFTTFSANFLRDRCQIRKSRKLFIFQSGPIGFKTRVNPRNPLLYPPVRSRWDCKLSHLLINSLTREAWTQLNSI
jgi:hypothetical protein